MVQYILPVLAVLSASTAIGMVVGRFIRHEPEPEPAIDECAQMALIAERTIAREEEWIPELMGRIAARSVEIDRLNSLQRDDQHALNVITLRKRKAEVAQ